MLNQFDKLLILFDDQLSQFHLFQGWLAVEIIETFELLDEIIVVLVDEWVEMVDFFLVET